MKNKYYVSDKVDKKILFKGKAFDVAEYSVEINGKRVKRDIIERKYGVVIVPIDAEKNVYMISEYCAGSNSFILSLPGGKIEDNEKDNIVQAAKRELREEIGFSAKEMIKLQFCYTHPSTSNRKSYSFMAYGLVKNPLPKTNEIIETIKMPLDDAIKLCYEDFKSDVSTISNLYMAKQKLMEMGI